MTPSLPLRRLGTGRGGRRLLARAHDLIQRILPPAVSPCGLLVIASGCLGKTQPLCEGARPQNRVSPPFFPTPTSPLAPPRLRQCACARQPTHTARFPRTKIEQRRSCACRGWLAARAGARWAVGVWTRGRRRSKQAQGFFAGRASRHILRPTSRRSKAINTPRREKGGFRKAMICLEARQ
jgi:hypothetical protein